MYDIIKIATVSISSVKMGSGFGLINSRFVIEQSHFIFIKEKT